MGEEVRSLDGVFIYWFGWILWIMITFFQKKTTERLINVALLLLLLACLPLTFSIDGMTVSVVFAALIAYICWQMRSFSWRMICFLLVVSWTIAAAYGAFQLMLIFDPVIELLDTRWMSAGIAFLLACLFVRHIPRSCLLAVAGLLQGEFVFHFVLQQFFHLQGVTGSLYFFDIVAVTVFFYGVLLTAKGIVQLLQETAIRRPFSSLEKTS